MRAPLPRHARALHDVEHRSRATGGWHRARAHRPSAATGVRRLAVRATVREAENAGASERFVSLLNTWRGLGTMRLSGTECLALEMSLHEESERRALEGELALLEAAWRDAEELAQIADSI